MRVFWLLAFFFCGSAYAAPLHFPALSGRVVDEAQLLTPQAQEALTQQLADYEQGSGQQLVVVTLSSLQGDSIEDYGYKLGRAWGIGQKGSNNGALLIIAPKEHGVRIEVGYGLEGTLTDAVSSEIIHGVIIPDFKAGHMQQGILDGASAIIAALGGKSAHAPAQQDAPQEEGQLPAWEMILILIAIFFFMRFGMRHPVLTGLWLASNSSRFGGSGFGGGGFSGFSGGGGSFGGGGASGSW